MCSTDIYEVEEILSKRFLHFEWHYLVKWKNYSVSESTWETIANIKNCHQIILDFENKY